VNPRRIGDRLVWVVRSNDLTHWATRDLHDISKNCSICVKQQWLTYNCNVDIDFIVKCQDTTLGKMSWYNSRQNDYETTIFNSPGKGAYQLLSSSGQRLWEFILPITWCPLLFICLQECFCIMVRVSWLYYCRQWFPCNNFWVDSAFWKFSTMTIGAE